MELRSRAFDHSGTIPEKHTGDGQNVSPEISWSGLPDGTAELALLVDDPDAPTPYRARSSRRVQTRTGSRSPKTAPEARSRV